MKGQSLTKKTGPYVYMLPTLPVFVVSLFYPFFRTTYLSLYKTNKMDQTKLFVGSGDYMEPLTSKSFFNSLTVTLAFVVIVVAGSMILGLLSAILCNHSFLGIRVLSTAYVLPMTIASSFVAMIFRTMPYPSIGIVNKLLRLDINWVNDPKYALVCVALLTTWPNSGISSLHFPVSLNNIDESTYERASVDRVGEAQKFSRLTLLGLSSIMFYTLVVNIIQAFQAFGRVKILTKGGPGESTDLIAHSIHRDAFFNYRLGSAVTQSVILFAIAMALALVMFKIEKRGVGC